MKDIVRILQQIAEDKNLTYHYGKKAALNLLEGSLDADKIYLLHEFTNRKSEYNRSGTKIIGANYEGKFFLVKQSDLTQNYFDPAEDSACKYFDNIEPLLAIFTSIGNAISCMDFTVNQWENIDVTDAMDANMDGLLCSYKIRVPNDQ